MLSYIVGGSDPRYSFIADEFLLFAALPVLGALSAGFTLVEQRDAAAQERDEAVDRGQLWQLRMCTLAALIGCTGGPTRGGRIWCSRRPSGLRRRSAAHAAVSGRALGVAAAGLRALAAGVPEGAALATSGETAHSGDAWLMVLRPGGGLSG